MITIILAGGLGKRMESDLPKVLHKVNNLPMIIHVIKTSQSSLLNSKKTIIIVGIYKDIIKNVIDFYIDSGFIKDNIEYVIQPKPLGTGHAILCTLPCLNNENILNIQNNNILILSGDVPLISENTLFELCNGDNYNNNNKILITELDNPYGCGRIIFDEYEYIKEIVEEKDCTSSQRDIKYVNCGIYCIKSQDLINFVPKIGNNNKSAEYYFTDIVKIMGIENKNIGYHILEKNKHFEIMNVNTKKDLEKINDIIKYVKREF